MAEATGIYTGSAYSDKTFYGFKQNNVTGDTTVNIINDGTTTVVLPDDNIIDPDGYKTWFWSADTVSFSWGSNGHLLMEWI